MADIIQIRRDTAANWASANPTLAQGELGTESDTTKIKIGDGTTAWNSLGYLINTVDGYTYGRNIFTATASQTTFSVTYSVGYVDVYMNGVKLILGTDYTATDGTSVVLTVGASSGDIIEIIDFKTFAVANALQISDLGVSVQAYDADTTKNDVANTFTQNQTITGTLASGAFTASGNIDGDFTTSVYNANTGASADAQLRLQCNTKYVDLFVNYNGSYFQESSKGTGVTAKYSDFDTNYFRTTTGVEIANFSSNGLTVTGTGTLGADGVDYIQAIGATGTARVEVVGGSTNSNLALSSKGTGSIYFWSNGYGSNLLGQWSAAGGLAVTGNQTITSSATTGFPLEIVAPSLTTGRGIRVTVDGITGGSGILAQTNSATMNGAMLDARITHASSTGYAIFASNAGTGDAVLIDNNGSGNALSADGGNIVLTNGQYIEEYAATGTSGAVTIDLDTGNNFSTAMAGAVTYTFSNAATSGTVSSFTLKVVNNGSAITWPASVDWPAGTAPTLSASGATDVFVFYTHDGGTTWYGFTAGQAMA